MGICRGDVEFSVPSAHTVADGWWTLVRSAALVTKNVIIRLLKAYVALYWSFPVTYLGSITITGTGTKRGDIATWTSL